MLVRFELGVNAGDALVNDCDRFRPGFEDFGGVTGIEGARMRLFGGISALGFFEFLLEVGEALVEVLFAHGLRLHGECECA